MARNGLSHSSPEITSDYSLIFTIFVEDKLHSGNREQVLFPLVCIIFGE